MPGPRGNILRPPAGSLWLSPGFSRLSLIAAMRSSRSCGQIAGEKKTCRFKRGQRRRAHFGIPHPVAKRIDRAVVGDGSVILKIHAPRFAACIECIRKQRRGTSHMAFALAAATQTERHNAIKLHTMQ
jgi:hypothetical protein